MHATFDALYEDMMEHHHILNNNHGMCIYVCIHQHILNNNHGMWNYNNH